MESGASSKRKGTPNETIEALWERAWQTRLRDFPEALHLGRELFDRAAQLEDLKWKGRALLVMGSSSWRLNDYRQALQYLYEALGLFEEIEDRQGQATTLMDLATTYYYLSDYATSVELNLKSLRLHEALGDDAGRANVLNNMGIYHHWTGAYEEALRAYRESYQIRVQLSNLDDQAASHNNIGKVLTQLGRLDEALSELEQARHIWSSNDNERGLGMALNNLGAVYAAQEKHKLAQEHFEASLKIKDRLNDNNGMSETLIHFGRLLLRLGKHQYAQQVLQRAADKAAQIGAKRLHYEAQLVLAETYEQTGHYRLALEHYKRHHQLEREVFNEESDQRLKNLQVSYQLERAEQEKEIHRLKHVQLAEAYQSLQELHTQLEQQRRLLERQSTEDPLTGLFNRRYLDSRLGEAFRRSQRYAHPLSVALMDLDFFKRINDKLSHAVGDEVLKTVARILQDNTRETDIVSRYGGEEFAVVFIDTPLEQAVQAGEKIRRTIENHPWHEIHPDLKVTVSIGFSDDLTLENHEHLLNAADTKLYEAKQAGKNRVKA